MVLPEGMLWVQKASQEAVYMCGIGLKRSSRIYINVCNYKRGTCKIKRAVLLFFCCWQVSFST